MVAENIFMNATNLILYRDRTNPSPDDITLASVAPKYRIHIVKVRSYPEISMATVKLFLDGAKLNAVELFSPLARIGQVSKLAIIDTQTWQFFNGGEIHEMAIELDSGYSPRTDEKKCNFFRCKLTTTSSRRDFSGASVC